MTRYDYPLFVTPHAIRRFNEKVAPRHGATLTPEAIIDLVQQQATKGRWINEPGRDDWVMQGYYNDRPFYMVLERGEEEWPAVVTIMGEEAMCHRALVRRTAQKVYHPFGDIWRFIVAAPKQPIQLRQTL